MPHTHRLLLLVFACVVPAQSTAQDDAFLNTPQLIQKYGYTVEQHKITSEDGYITTAFRMPYGKDGANATAPSKPLLLMHGLLQCSDAWFLLQNESLAFLLADNGYDVWLPNGRGNNYSIEHVTLDPDSSEFWEFSWHEQGIYDIPATIDYILDETGATAIDYIGYSMGGTMYFVMVTERPEYIEKLITAVLLAPAVFLGNMNNPLLRTLAPLTDPLATVVGTALHGQIPPSRRADPDNTNVNSTASLVLTILINALTGSFNPKEADLETYVSQRSRGSCGGSVRQPQHFGQEVNSKLFRQFDYGFLKNLAKYKQLSPPNYNLNNVNGRVVVFGGDGDSIVTPKDLQILCESLPDAVGHFITVEEEGFQHSDFVTGKNAPTLVYDILLSLIRNNDTLEKVCLSIEAASRARGTSKNKKSSTSKAGVIRRGRMKSRRQGAHQQQNTRSG